MVDFLPVELIRLACQVFLDLTLSYLQKREMIVQQHKKPISVQWQGVGLLYISTILYQAFLSHYEVGEMLDQYDLKKVTRESWLEYDFKGDSRYI